MLEDFQAVSFRRGKPPRMDGENAHQSKWEHPSMMKMEKGINDRYATVTFGGWASQT
jgi:hypothetical protein